MDSEIFSIISVWKTSPKELQTRSVNAFFWLEDVITTVNMLLAGLGNTVKLAIYSCFIMDSAANGIESDTVFEYAETPVSLYAATLK